MRVLLSVGCGSTIVLENIKLKNMKQFFLLVALLIWATQIQAQTIREMPPYTAAQFWDLPISSGRVVSIAVNPTNDKEIIVSHHYCGLWKTIDGGDHWYFISGLSNVFTQDVQFSPDGRTVFCAVANDNQIVNGAGIYISRDGGDTWIRPVTASIPLPAWDSQGRYYASAISIAPDNSDKVYVTTSYGVAVSNDNGNTWNHHTIKMTDSWPLISGSSVQAMPLNQALVATNSGIYKTIDGGNTWRQIRAGNYTANFKLMDIHPRDYSVVFIMESYNNMLIYENTAESFSSISLPGGQSRAPFVRASKANCNKVTLWAGLGTRLAKVTRRDLASFKSLIASDWTIIGRGEGLHDDSGHLGLNGTGKPIMYGSDGGLFCPNNNTYTSWQRACKTGSGMNSYEITDIDGTNYDDGRFTMYFATQDNGIWSSNNMGSTWINHDCCEGFHIETAINSPTPESAKIAYGSVGGHPGPRFSGDNLNNQIDVSNASTSGGTLNGMAEAFRLPLGNWIRLRRLPGSAREVYVSTDGGNNWRRRYNINLPEAGIFQVANMGFGKAYIPCWSSDRTPDGKDIAGLMPLLYPTRTGTVTLGNSNLIKLPDNGSLGVRATEFDWHAVFGLHPTDRRYLICPDIYNNVVKVTRDAGSTWITDNNLTNLVLQGGRLNMYHDPWHMQVWHIEFDPYKPSRILVGTRDAGIIYSEDDGRNWQVVPGSEKMQCVSGFFFRPNNRVVASSYGHGLWEINFDRFIFGRPSLALICERFPELCFFRMPFDYKKIITDPHKYLNEFENRYSFITVFNGKINGIVLQNNIVKEISVTPGSIVKFEGGREEVQHVKITESLQGIGFKKLRSVQSSIHDGEVLHSIVLSEKNVIESLVSGKRMLVQELPDLELPDEEQVNEQQEDKNPHPYTVFLSTAISQGGLPVIGKDNVIFLSFPFLSQEEIRKRAGRSEILLDDTVNLKYDLIQTQNGNNTMRVTVPQEIQIGQHTITLKNFTDDALPIISKFIKATLDDFPDRVKNDNKKRRN